MFVCVCVCIILIHYRCNEAVWSTALASAGHHDRRRRLQQQTLLPGLPRHRLPAAGPKNHSRIVMATLLLKKREE